MPKIVSPERPWILAVHAHSQLSGCEAYRMWLPLRELERNGRRADWVRSERVEDMSVRVLDYDVYVAQRHTIANPTFMELARQYGKRFVFEVDDDFTNEHRHVIADEHYDDIWNYVRAADAITVSTPYLGDLMATRTDKPVYVLPNSLDWRVWSAARKPQKALTIGLSGSFTHAADWQVLEDVLPRVLGNHPQVRLEVYGYVPDFVQALLPTYGERILADDSWVDYRDYPSRIGRFDIGLCPVDPTDQFNWSKSGIKATELLAVGAGVVATDMNIYRPILGQNNARGLLVQHTPAAWYDALHALITNERMRQELGEQGRHFVRQHYCIDRTWHLWWRAYRDIAQRR